MPCTPTTGLSHSYISQWANLTMLHQSPSLEVPSLDPIPSPARGRGRGRRSRNENDSDECHTPRDRRSNCSPHPLQPVSSRGSLANLPVVARTRATRRQPPMPHPTLQFRRLQKGDKPAATLQRTPSDVTNQQRTETTPSPDLIFNMSPVLGFEGPSSRPYRVASRLSAEPDVMLSEAAIRIDQPRSFLYSYIWDPPADLPTPSLETRTISIATSRDRTTTSGLDNTASELLADESSALSQLDESELAVPGLVGPAVQEMPRLGRMHAKSDPLPARLSSTSPEPALRTQPIPIPKPSPRVPSDFGGVSSISVSLAPPAPLQQGGIPIPATRWARARSREQRKPENENLPVTEEVEDVTRAWCGTADAVPVPARRVPRKKRFFIPGDIGESYDGDMDSELSSWRPQ